MTVVRDSRGRFTRKPETVPKGWEGSTVLARFRDGSYVLRLMSVTALKTLGYQQGHCSGAEHHVRWAIKNPRTAFIALVDKDGQVHMSLHVKLVEWRGRDPLAYDWEYRQIGTQSRHSGISEAQGALKRAKLSYEHYKGYALQFGPLGPNNPYKYDVDRANRRVTTCVAALEAAKREIRLYRGQIFRMDRRYWYILSIHGRRGTTFNGQDDRHTPKLVKVLGKEYDLGTNNRVVAAKRATSQ